MTFIRGKSSAEAGNRELGADKRTSAVWESLLGRPPCFSSFATSRKLPRGTLDASHASISFGVNEVVFDAWARSQSRTLALLALDFDYGGQFEKATVVSVLTVALVVAAAFLARALGGRVGIGSQ